MKDLIRQFIAQYQVARIRAAHNKYLRLLATTPRHWKAASIGGSTNIAMGPVTQAEAIKRLSKDGHSIGYIDAEAGFIALVPTQQNHPE